MNFNSRIAKVGKGKFVNGYQNKSGEISLYMYNGGLTKKILTDTNGVFDLDSTSFKSGFTEIIKLKDDVFVKRVQQNIKVESSEE